MRKVKITTPLESHEWEGPQVDDALVREDAASVWPWRLDYPYSMKSEVVEQVDMAVRNGGLEGLETIVEQGWEGIFYDQVFQG